MRFVGIKTTEQQDIKSTLSHILYRIRERLIMQGTALANQIRSFLMEYGIFIAKGIYNLRRKLPMILAEGMLSGLIK